MSVADEQAPTGSFALLADPPRPSGFASSGAWLVALRHTAGFDVPGIAEPLAVGAGRFCI